MLHQWLTFRKSCKSGNTDDGTRLNWRFDFLKLATEYDMQMTDVSLLSVQKESTVNFVV
jgi:hypothetical protein